MRLTPIGENQSSVTIGNAFVLFSYSTPVAAIIDGKEYKTEKKWGVTTSKHINGFLISSKDAELKPQQWFDNFTK